jgi:PIN domain nuclease of toxin-antitoxin system
LKLLLDTNVFIWASCEPELLTAKVRSVLTDPYHDRYVSVASIWEMQIKHALGKLPLPGKADETSQAWMRPLVARLLPIELRHLGKLYDLLPAHRDPFDRILVAQALDEGMEIVSPDPLFHLYNVPIIW